MRGNRLVSSEHIAVLNVPGSKQSGAQIRFWGEGGAQRARARDPPSPTRLPTHLNVLAAATVVSKLIASPVKVLH